VLSVYKIACIFATTEKLCENGARATARAQPKRGASGRKGAGDPSAV